MQVALITVRRDPPYIHQTISSYYETGSRVTPIGERRTLHEWPRLDIFVGSPDLRDVVEYAEAKRVINESIVVYELDMPTWVHWAQLQPFRRAAGNFLRALETRIDERDDVLLLEDDIVFKPKWRDALDDARAAHPEALITLYTHPSIASHLQGLPDGFYVIPWEVFYGTLALYVPQKIRRALADYVRARYDKLDRRWPFDECVRYFVKEHGVPIIATVPSWVDHVGTVPAIEENRKHGPRRSPMF